MEIDKDILLECICYYYKYEFSELTDYQVRNDYILATVVSDNDMSEYYIGTRSVDIDIDEYEHFIRKRKLRTLNKKLHS